MTPFDVLKALGQVSSDALDRAEADIKKSVKILNGLGGK